MTPRLYWQNYVNRFKDTRAVADHLGIPYSTVTSVCNGFRGIGRDLAARMVAADPTLDASILIWVRPLQAGERPCAKRSGTPRDRAA